MLNTHRSVFEGVYTLAKFYLSRSPDGKMNCISRTLGKFSIIDREFEGTINDQDLWVCKIVKEIHPRQNIGAFVLSPIERVEADKIKKIIPGFYDVQVMERAVNIVPNTDPHDFWMLSKSTRKIFSKKYYAVIVPLAYKEKEEPKQKYNVEKPETLSVESVQAKVKATGDVVKVVPFEVPLIDSCQSRPVCVAYIDRMTNRVYTIQELEPVKIMAEQESITAMAPVINARFKATATMN